MRLIKFIEKNKLLNDNQFGFRSGMSTEDALAKVTNFIYDKLYKGNSTPGVFLDLAKAFDTVDHEILLRKLYGLGIGGTPLDLFENYLKGRTEVTKNDNVYIILSCRLHVACLRKAF